MRLTWVAAAFAHAHMDQEKRKRLIETAKARGYTGRTPLVLVTRHEFFDGNNDTGSIGCNLDDHPGVDTFDAAFRKIEGMDGVAGVYLDINEIDETYDDMWPFADTACIVSRLPASAFEPVLRPLQPDEIAPSEELFLNPPEIPIGYQLIRVWWD